MKLKGGLKVKTSKRLNAEGGRQKAEGRGAKGQPQKAEAQKPRAEAGATGSGKGPKKAQKQEKTAKPGNPRDEIMAFINQAVKTKPQPSGPQQARGPDHTPSTYRLFYALRVPGEITQKLAETQRKLKGNWRSVRPDQMHVTLCYLPAVPPERVEDLKRLGTQLMQNLPPMRIDLRGTGYFPNEGSPRVWFVKVEAEGLNELAQAIRAGVQALGLETEDLPFKAHITLARKKGPAPRIPPITFETGWTATGGTLYRSHLRKTGPIYEPQSTFRFQGGAPPPPTAATEPETQPDTQETQGETP